MILEILCDFETVAKKRLWKDNGDPKTVTFWKREGILFMNAPS